MRIFKYCLLLLMLILYTGISYAVDLPDSVFPWGAYAIDRTTADERDAMRDELGLNFVFLAWDNWDNQDIIDFMDDGFAMYPNRAPDIGDGINYFKYGEAHYSIIYANDDSSEYRFYVKNDVGSDEIYGFFPYEDTIAENGPEIVLDSLWIKQERNNDVLGQYPINYTRELCMRIDTAGVLASDTLVILKMYESDVDGCPGILVDSIYITGSSFATCEPETVNCGSYTKSSNYNRSYFRIYSTCETEVYFNFLKISCYEGRNLIDGGLYDRGIKQSAATLFNGKNVAGWYLSDEPCYDNFRPLRYIDSLIIDTTYALGWPDTARVATLLTNPLYNAIYDFIDYSKPEMVWCDIYEFYGGARGDSSGTIRQIYTTDYTGSGSTDEPDGRHYGLQLKLNEYARQADTINQACMEKSKEWWAAPQCFGYLYKDYNGWDWNDKWWWRLPTESELKATTFMSLCYGAKGRVFWRYHYNNYASVYAPGMVDSLSNHTSCGDAVEDMAPYIKVLEPILNDLHYQDAYYCSSSTETFPNNIVKSVKGVSEGDNPDLGWFNIGEFYDDSDNYYFMLVNRACNINSITLAPDVTAIVEINRGAFNNATSLYVIDIAHDVEWDSVNGEWEAIPETTYTTLYDNKLYFTTELKAGEGRLFKIATILL